MEDKNEFKLHEFSRYKYIIENIKDVIWELNSEFEFTFISPNVKRMVGFEAEEMIGHKIYDLLTEDSKERFFGLIESYFKHKKGDGNEDITANAFQFICKDKSIKWIEVSPKPIFENGQFMGYIGITRDISEKKAYERQLNRYIEELEKMNDELSRTATTDILTGTFNRRKFEDDLESILSRKGRHDQFSLILFDIDHFKSVNDRLGHRTGDLVLQRISRLVLSNIRKTDRLFRWGGEEFIIILPDTKLESARLVAGKIRDLIENENFGFDMSITISLGVSEHRGGENADQLISRIDNALYQAKLQGRNRVVCCELDDPMLTSS